MHNPCDDTFEGKIVAVLRSTCIGFQRHGAELVPVIESLVRPKEGPPTRVYQVRSRDGSISRTLRRRPHIDIPAPSRTEY